jgi:hypothetical protein
LTYFFTEFAINVSKSSTKTGNGSSIVFGAGGVVEIVTPPAARLVAADKVPLVFGVSIAADAMSSSRDVAASSLIIRAVSAVRGTVTRASIMVAILDLDDDREKEEKH